MDLAEELKTVYPNSDPILEKEVRVVRVVHVKATRKELAIVHGNRLVCVIYEDDAGHVSIDFRQTAEVAINGKAIQVKMPKRRRRTGENQWRTAK